MKKLVVIMLVALFVIVALGCGASGGGRLELKEEDGALTCTDTETSPLDGGLKVTVNKEDKTVTMQITDGNGEPTVEFYKFSVEEETCHRYRYVAMMGTGFNYIYDYNKGELLKVLDNDNEDKTESTKSSGRFEGAQTETKENVEALQTYFEEAFGMTIEKSVE